MGGDRVSEDVCARTMALNAGFPKCGLRNAGEDHRGGERFVRWTQVEEDPAMSAGWPPLLQIAHQRLADILGQREDTFTASFAGADQKVPRTPIDIFQLKSHDLTSPKAQPRQ